MFQFGRSAISATDFTLVAPVCANCGSVMIDTPLCQRRIWSRQSPPLWQRFTYGAASPHLPRIREKLTHAVAYPANNKPCATLEFYHRLAWASELVVFPRELLNIERVGLQSVAFDFEIDQLGVVLHLFRLQFVDLLLQFEHVQKTILTHGEVETDRKEYRQQDKPQDFDAVVRSG